MENMSFEELEKVIDTTIKSSDWSKEGQSNGGLMYDIQRVVRNILGKLWYNEVFTNIDRNKIVVYYRNCKYICFTIKVTRKQTQRQWSSWSYEQYYSYSGVSIEHSEDYNTIQEMINYGKDRDKKMKAIEDQREEDFRDILQANNIDLKTFYKIKNMYGGLTYKQKNQLEKEAEEE